MKDRLATDWSNTPTQLTARLKSLTQKVHELPDQTAVHGAQSFLTTAQLRLADYRETQRKRKAVDMAFKVATLVHDTYCEVMEKELNSLYDEVEQDFSAFYRAINRMTNPHLRHD